MTDILLSSVGVVVGVVVGGIITWRVARAYYEKASNDLDRAAEELRRETKRVRGRVLDLFVALDEAGLIEVEWEETGDDIRGVVIRRTFGVQATLSGVEQEPERAEPRPATEEAQTTTEHHQAQRPTEGVEHDAGTLREWTDDVESRPRPDAPDAQEGERRPWWRRFFGG